MIDKSALRILVLDDEPFILKLICRVLTNLGFPLVTAYGSGRSALEWMDCPNRPPDLILLDLNMPEMDGLEFVRHLVDRHYLGSLILVSGEDERMLQTTEKLVLAHKISVLGHLHKPVKPEDLSALLEQCTLPSLDGSPTAKKAYSSDELQAAIANGELVNYYQPKVNMANGKVIGVESLVRWHHPQDGMVFPDQFIGVAEEHGLIDDLTRVVVDAAFAQTKIWQNNGLYLRVGINISMDNLATLAFADYIIAAASAAGIAPGGIVLEVTESQLMRNLTVPLEILTRLCLKRFSLSIDDFGTGHSSLSKLRDIPFHELKIDQGFVHGAADNDTLRAICCASLSLAQQMGMETVGEGVEDQADWDFLRSMSCDLAQGYFIAKPMPAAKIPDWISAWEANIGNVMKLPYEN
ncbi:MAG: EAL domain-containing response regulator [Gammaproteobacteria bacterium]